MAAARANAGATGLALLTLLAVPWLLLSAVRGRWFGWKPDSNLAAWVLIGTIAISVVQWGLRLLTE